MPNMVRPFKVLSIVEEPDGGQGVAFEVTKTNYLTETKTRTVKMVSYLSVPKGEDVEMSLFNYLETGDWL